MIGLDDDADSGRLNQMSDLFNHPHKTCNLELCRPVILLGGDEEPRKKKKWLDQAIARPTALRQIFIGRGMKDNCSEFKLLGGVQVNPQGFIGVMMYKSRGVAQGLLNALERRMLLESRGS